MNDESLNFEEHHRRREENASVVRCARCKQWIVATATKCPECGVHFQGEAQDFADEPTPKDGGFATWVVVVAVLLLITFLVGVLGPG